MANACHDGIFCLFSAEVQRCNFLSKKEFFMNIRILGFLLLSCLTLAACSSDQASKFDEAMQAQAEKNYSKAVELFLIEAKRGDAAAQYNLGNMYATGKGVRRI